MKKSNVRLISITILLLFWQVQTHAQWVQADGPYGGMITCFAVSGTNLFAGTMGGDVFRSTDNGASWTKVPTCWLYTRVYALAVNSSYLFAGTDGKGVFRSADNGASWSEVNYNLANRNVYALFVSGANLFAGTIGGGVFRSTDNGASWTEINSGLTSKTVLALTMNGPYLFTGTDNGVFGSADNGASWTDVNNGLANKMVRSFTVSGSNLFAGTDGGVFRSADNGTSWTEVSNGLTNRYVQALALGGSYLFAGTNRGGVFRSADNGASWTEVNNGLTNKVVKALAVNGSNLFAGTSGNGVFRSADNGESWSAVNTGLSNTIVRALAVSGTNLFAGTTPGGVFRSADNGASWTEENTGMLGTAVYTYAVSGTNLFAGTDYGVFISTNSGANWIAVNTGLTYTVVYALAVSGANLFAGTTGGGVFRSTSYGESWTEINNGLTNKTVRALAVSGSNLFAGTEGGMFRSTNNGASWAAVNTGLSNPVVSAIAVNGSNLFAGTMGGGVFRSSDNGASWTEVNAGLTNLVVWDFAANGSNLFMATSGGVFISTNNGSSWTEVNHGLANPYVYALAVSGSNLFAGSAYSVVWRRPIAEMINTASLSFHRGLHLAGWFDELRPGQININRYTDEDFRIFHAMGCEAVRLPIDLLHMTGPAPGYELDPLLFELLDLAVDRAEAAGLFMVLLNSTWDQLFGTAQSLEPVLLAAWTQMAHHFKNRSNLVMYEILNEPHGISDSDWNGIQGRVIQAIRAEDRLHTIVVTPGNYGSYLNLDAMTAYADDDLLYTFHFYDPYIFTHQGITWGDPAPSDLVGVPFPYEASAMPSLPASLAGSWWQDLYNSYAQQGNEGWVKSQLDVAVQFQSQRNVRLWCGEFGAYPPGSSSDDRAAWTGVVRSYMEDKGIAWTFFTDWMFEKNTSGCLYTDVDTMITSALGMTAPAQKEPAAGPETSGFSIYDDFIAPGLIESGWFSIGEYDLYSKQSPCEGVSCLKITGFEQYGNISFRFSPFCNLSFLADHESTLDFWLRCASPGTWIDIRFEDTKASDPDDHPWRRSTSLSSSIVAWDGKWHHLSIPLANFVESGSWDDNQWYDPKGLFDWKAVDRLTIVAEHHSLSGIEIFFDNIRISDPVTRVTSPGALPMEYQLRQNYPNPFNQSTVIQYRLPHGTDVKVAVYNTRGQLVAVLVQGYREGGEHKVVFESGSLSSGVYLYRLKTANFEDVRKFIFMRR